jgi:thiol:disulfide interchange protein DsbD
LNPRLFLRALVLLAAISTISFAAPTIKLAPEGEADYAAIGAGQWFDLLVTIDPKGEPVAADGLVVKAAADGAQGIEVGAAILPPAAKGAYERPFTLRVPLRINSAGEVAVSVVVTNKAGLKLTAERKVEASEHYTGHVTGTAKLKQPAKVGVPNAVVLDLTILPGYHVYGKAGTDGVPIVATLLPGIGSPAERLFTGGGPSMPEGKKYDTVLTFEIPFTPARAGKVSVRALLNWQACTDQVCDPNEIAYLPLAFDVAEGDGAAVVPVDGSGEAAATVTSGSGGRQDLATQPLWAIVLGAIGAGLIALAMPCTYPLIPITISFFTKQAEVRDGKVTGLALAYGGGIVAVMVIAGVIVGEPILAFAANKWVNLLFAIMFVYFGLSLVGMFDIRLPGWVNNLAAKASGTGGYMSVFMMGTTLVITSFTCTAPFVGLLLVFAAGGGSLAKVALAMAVFGLTMAIPFVFLSLSPKAMQKLPKSGMWMKTLKVTLGILELGIVMKFVSNIDLAINTPPYIGRELFLALWSVSFVAAGLYLLGATSVFSKTEKWSMTTGRGIAAVLMLAIAAYLIDGSTGKRKAGVIEAFVPPNPSYGKAFLAVSHEDYEKGLELARKHNAPVFLHFTGYI